MAGVALASPFFLALRGDVQSEQLACALIVGLATVILACKLSLDELARRKTQGLPTGLIRRTWIVVSSCVNTLALIALANGVFLSGYLLLSSQGRPSEVSGTAMVLGLISAWLFARFYSRLLGFVAKPLATPRPPPGPPEEVNAETWN